MRRVNRILIMTSENRLFLLNWNPKSLGKFWLFRMSAEQVHRQQAMVQKQAQEFDPTLSRNQHEVAWRGRKARLLSSVSFRWVWVDRGPMWSRWWWRWMVGIPKPESPLIHLHQINFPHCLEATQRQKSKLAFLIGNSWSDNSFPDNCPPDNSSPMHKFRPRLIIDVT